MSSVPPQSRSIEGRGSDLLDGRGGSNVVSASSFQERKMSKNSQADTTKAPRYCAFFLSVTGLPSSCLICMGEQYTIAYTRKMVRSGRSTQSTLTMNSLDALFRGSLRRRIPRYQLRITYARSKASMQQPALLLLDLF
jgi:hypothetical protein